MLQSSPDPLAWLLEGLRQDEPPERVAEELLRLIRRYICKHHSVHNSDLDTVVLEAAKRVYYRLDTFSGLSKLSTWICGIARFVVLEHLRERGATVFLEDVASEIGEDIDPEAMAISQMAVDEALDALSEEERKIVDMIQDGMTYDEVGAQVGRTGNNVGRILRYRIARKMAEHLDLQGWLPKSTEPARRRACPAGRRQE